MNQIEKDVRTYFGIPSNEDSLSTTAPSFTLVAIRGVLVIILISILAIFCRELKN